MIFPKKEILFSPMLGTLGGGSMRSFGRGTGGSTLYDFSSHTFSNAGAFGQLGPTLAMARTAYDPVTVWNDNSGAAGANIAWDLDTALFNVPYDGLQLWTVPEDATYNFDLRGAAGGPAMFDTTLSPGRPQRIYNAKIELEVGQKLLIAIGQRGGEGLNQSGNSGAGGGGGTFVCKFGEGAGANGFADNAIKPLLIASGGNGEPYSGWYVGGPNARPTSALTGTSATTNTPGGTTWLNLSKTYGRGGFGGGFNVDWKLMREQFAHYPTASQMGQANYANPHVVHGAALLTDTDYSNSYNDKYWGELSSRSLRGGDAEGQTSGADNARTQNNSAFGFGGFGGGGGSKHEGGGGGGYHGGATQDTNQTSTVYAYGAVSYISSSINAGSVETLYSTPSISYLNTAYINTEPFWQLNGSCTITKV